MSRRPPAYAVFGRVDWERPEPFHQVAERLAEQHPVVYVEFPHRIGRAPGGRTRTPAPGVLSLRPVEFPLQRVSALRRATERSTARDIRRALGAGAHPVVAIAYPRSPLPVIRELCPDLVVYHAIDDFSVRRDGTRDEAFLGWEQEALELADVVCAVSAPLATRLQHRRAVVLPNGYDERAFVREGPLDAAIAALPGPRFGFVGTVRIERIDLALVRALVTKHPAASCVFVGPVIGASAEWDEIASRENVHVLGPRAFSEIPAVVRALDVAISPYRDTHFDRACSPLKVIEALAMGIPAIASPARPDLQDLEPFARFVSTPEAFADSVNDVPRMRAPRESVPSWLTVTRALEAHVAEGLRSPR